MTSTLKKLYLRCPYPKWTHDFGLLRQVRFLCHCTFSTLQEWKIATIQQKAKMKLVICGNLSTDECKPGRFQTVEPEFRSLGIHFSLVGEASRNLIKPNKLTFSYFAVCLQKQRKLAWQLQKQSPEKDTGLFLVRFNIYINLVEI